MAAENTNDMDSRTSGRGGQPEGVFAGLIYRLRLRRAATSARAAEVSQPTQSETNVA